MTAKYMIVIAGRAAHHLLVGDIYEGSMTRKMRLVYLVRSNIKYQQIHIKLMPLLPPCLDFWDIIFKNIITVICLFKGVPTKLDKSKIQPKASSM